MFDEESVATNFFRGGAIGGTTMNFDHKPKIIGRIFRSNLIAISIAILAALPPTTAGASQIEGHLFFASKMLSGPVRTYLADDPQLIRMYMLGAITPDSLWVAHLATAPETRSLLKKNYKVTLPGYTEKLQSLIADVHRAQPIAVTLSLLTAAQTPEECAYALGWITHFIVDSHIHALINRWGGYSDKDFDLQDPNIAIHNKLESLEARHVLTHYSDEFVLMRFSERDIQTPANYIVRALASAYQDNPAYQPPLSTDFIILLHQSESLMLDSSRWFYYQATHSPQEIARLKSLMKRFRRQKWQKLELLTDLPDKKLYLSTLATSPFIHEWETIKEEALASSRDILPLCVLYLWLQQHHSEEQSDPLSADLLTRIGQELRRISPNDDLIKPKTQ